MNYRIYSLVLLLILFGTTVTVVAQEHNHGHDHDTAHTSTVPVHDVTATDTHSDAHAAPAKYNPSPAVMHHIGDAHEFHIIGDVHLPLPCATYVPGQGLKFAMSSAFQHGSKAINGFAMDHGILRRIKDFPVQDGEVALEAGEAHGDHGVSYVTHRELTAEGKKPVEIGYIKYQGKEYELEESAKLMKPASWYDFSVTKNVFTMLMALLALGWAFLGAARRYATNLVPKGWFGNLLETFYVFIRDEVAKPSIGPKYEKYMPFLLSLFFFILINNLFGLIPFFPFGANVMGNISSTIVLAVITFLVVNLSGNAGYWKHIVWMPDVPVPIKILMAPIEIAGLFIKPFTLLIRLFANITAGHTIILSLVSLIFVFGNVGESVSGAATGAAVAVPFVAFMNILEILVAFLQAFIFTLLASLYIGAAVEEHHHEEAHH